MTGQQLRHELMEVDFGIKPTDREVPDNLAQGIVRFLAKKHHITVPPAFFGEEEEGSQLQEQQENDVLPSDGSGEQEIVDERIPKEQKQDRKQDSLPVLRKLSLDGVSLHSLQQEAQKGQTGESTEEKNKVRIMPRQKRMSGTVLQEQIKRKEGVVVIPQQISVKEFAEKAGVQVPDVIQALMKNGVLATINQTIDFDTAAIIAADLGVDVQREQEKANVEDLFHRNLKELLKDDPDVLVSRPPIVVIMGHVDHGKTSLLDAIRHTDVVATESGGITQHIGAYQIIHNEKAITFLDTPGHEAFTAMRARGAQITDIAVLVVAADEGMKETTHEALAHIRDAGVPIIVAITKVDKPEADLDRIKGELAGYELQPEEWGGSTPVIACSALKKQGLNELLEHILLIAEMEEFKANPARPGIATVIESHLNPSLGSLATVIVNTGTLHIGDSFICGKTFGKVRSMMDAHGERLFEAAPSAAVQISGIQNVPDTGDILQVMSSEKEARGVHEQLLRTAEHLQKRGFSDLVARLSEGKLTQLKIVLKADAHGSLEAISEALHKQGIEKVSVKVIHGAVGAVSESDVMLASAGDAVVMAFHVPVSVSVRKVAQSQGVEIREYDVIYTLLDEVNDLLKGLLEPEETEKILGHLEVKGIFLKKGSEQLIGGRVLDGIIKRVPFRIQRGKEEVGTGRITSLRKVDKDIKEAKEGSECGMRVDATFAIEEGDIIEAFLMTQ